MKTRIQTANFINKQLTGDIETQRVKPYNHYGKQELRDLLDFIYEGEPKNSREEIPKNPEYKHPVDATGRPI